MGARVDFPTDDMPMEGMGEALTYEPKDIRFTRKGNSLYVIALDWPEDGQLIVESLNANVKISTGRINTVSMLGSDEKIKWERVDDGLTIHFPDEKPCEHAFVFKIELDGEWVL